MIEPVCVKEGGVRYQVVGDWARLAAGLNAVVKRILFVLMFIGPCIIVIVEE